MHQNIAIRTLRYKLSFLNRINQTFMQHFTRIKQLLLIAVVVESLLISVPAYAGENDKDYKRYWQNDQVTGRIIGADGQPLSGVSISVKGTNPGTTTDQQGQFSIQANRGEVLVVSSVVLLVVILIAVKFCKLLSLQ